MEQFPERSDSGAQRKERRAKKRRGCAPLSERLEQARSQNGGYQGQPHSLQGSRRRQ